MKFWDSFERIRGKCPVNFREYSSNFGEILRRKVFGKLSWNLESQRNSVKLTGKFKEGAFKICGECQVTVAMI